jgi:mannan polymerase II complex MNN10 subunit
MLMRAHPRTQEFLNIVRAYSDAHPHLSEQDCIEELIDSNQHDEDRRILMIPQWKINAFPEEIHCWDKSGKGWEPGIFVIHFAGAWAHVKEDDPTGLLMRKYEIYVDYP